MKKIKEIYNKFINWMNFSGRPFHIWGGLGMLFVNLVIGTALLGMSTIGAAILGTVNVAYMGISHEYKDKIEKNNFDWQDFAATMYFPIIMWVCILVYFITLI